MSGFALNASHPVSHIVSRVCIELTLSPINIFIYSLPVHIPPIPRIPRTTTVHRVFLPNLRIAHTKKYAAPPTRIPARVLLVPVRITPIAPTGINHRPMCFHIPFLLSFATIHPAIMRKRKWPARNEAFPTYALIRATPWEIS